MPFHGVRCDFLSTCSSAKLFHSSMLISFFLEIYLKGTLRPLISRRRLGILAFSSDSSMAAWFQRSPRLTWTTTSQGASCETRVPVTLPSILLIDVFIFLYVIFLYPIGIFTPHKRDVVIHLTCQRQKHLKVISAV